MTSLDTNTVNWAYHIRELKLTRRMRLKATRFVNMLPADIQAKDLRRSPRPLPPLVRKGVSINREYPVMNDVGNDASREQAKPST